MLNGITGAGAVCCQYAPSDLGGPGVSSSGPAATSGANTSRAPGGLLQRIGEAFDNAIHGGDGGGAQAQRLINSAARTYAGGANVIPFPMVNPFKPVLQTRAPVTALTRFPDRFTYSVASTGAEPDDEQSSFDGLSGLALADGNSGVGLGSAIDDLGPAPLPPVYVPRTSSGGSTLQTILGTIQATLPATIEAFRASPSNIFPGTSYNPYATNAGGVYPGTTAGTGRAAEDVGAGVGRAADTLGGTLSRFVAEHPYMVIGGGAALALWFMNPPRRR